ncbi:MAG: glycosyltransferase family 2 protein [Gammaproteobacteria bacterium]
MATVDLSIVIPVFNEAGNIAALIDEICGQLAQQPDYEIILVDDGSDDATPDVLRGCRLRHGTVRVLRHRNRCGQSAAIASGVDAATGTWIATLDGDGQNDPADILTLYRAMRAAPDDVLLIAGNRKRRRDNWLKRFSSRVANAARRAILKDATPDTGCGLKVFARATFLALPRFDHMHRFLPALVQRQGGRVVSVEVRHRARQHGVSKYGVHNRLWVGIIDTLGVRWLQRRTRRPQVTEIE